MSALQRMIRVYDRTMLGSLQRRYYENSGFFNFGYWGDGARTQREASVALVEQLIARIPGRDGNILDVACGIGATTERLTQYWPPDAITGINISDAQVAAARVRAPGCTFVVMDAAQLRFPDNHFSAIICVEAAFHFDTREKFLNEAFRVLKPGGTLVLSDILFRDIPASLSEFGKVPRANLISGIPDYRNLLGRTGFAGIEVKDETDRCLRSFCKNLSRWTGAEFRAGRLKRGRSLGVGLAFKLLSAYFGLVGKAYLLVSVRKPG